MADERVDRLVEEYLDQADRDLVALPRRDRIRIYIGGASAAERWIGLRALHLAATEVVALSSASTALTNALADSTEA